MLQKKKERLPEQVEVVHRELELPLIVTSSASNFLL